MPWHGARPHIASGRLKQLEITLSEELSMPVVAGGQASG
jgi:hypothetical protein